MHVLKPALRKLRNVLGLYNALHNAQRHSAQSVQRGSVKGMEYSCTIAFLAIMQSLADVMDPEP
jgi:hypothetical protein